MQPDTSAFTLFKADQAVLPVAALHLIEGLCRLLRKILPPRFEFLCRNSSHD
jgi:hypothetical protein